MSQSNEVRTLADSRYNKLFRLLRLPRLYRLLKILRLLKVLQMGQSSSRSRHHFLKRLKLNLGTMRMLRVLMNVLFLNHLIACIWFYTAKLDDFDPDTWVVKTELLDSEPFTQYVASYYWAFQTLTTVGYGDIPAFTTVERVISIVWMLIGIAFYSFAIGNLSSILANLDKGAAILMVMSVESLSAN